MRCHSSHFQLHLQFPFEIDFCRAIGSTLAHRSFSLWYCHCNGSLVQFSTNIQFGHCKRFAICRIFSLFISFALGRSISFIAFTEIYWHLLCRCNLMHMWRCAHKSKVLYSYLSFSLSVSLVSYRVIKKSDTSHELWWQHAFCIISLRPYFIHTNFTGWVLNICISFLSLVVLNFCFGQSCVVNTLTYNMRHTLCVQSVNKIYFLFFWNY